MTFAPVILQTATLCRELSEALQVAIILSFIGTCCPMQNLVSTNHHDNVAFIEYSSTAQD
jgi:hypothetical protein